MLFAPKLNLYNYLSNLMQLVSVYVVFLGNLQVRFSFTLTLLHSLSF